MSCSYRLEAYRASEAFIISRAPDILTSVTQSKKSILHIGSRDIILALRDDILRLEGCEVVSTISLADGPGLFASRPFDLVLVDVEGQGRVPDAEKLCAEIRTLHPGQKVAFVCNYLVSIESTCPNDIIHAQFDPRAFIEGVGHALE